MVVWSKTGEPLRLLRLHVCGVETASSNGVDYITRYTGFLAMLAVKQLHTDTLELLLVRDYTA